MATTLSEAQVIGIVSLALILSGAVVVSSMKDSYYCQPEDNVKECLKLSSTGVTCYMLSGSDRCTGGRWEPIENFVHQQASVERREGIFYTKDPSGKTCYEYGDLRRPTLCK